MLSRSSNAIAYLPAAVYNLSAAGGWASKDCPIYKHVDCCLGAGQPDCARSCYDEELHPQHIPRAQAAVPVCETQHFKCTIPRFSYKIPRFWYTISLFDTRFIICTHVRGLGLLAHRAAIGRYCVCECKHHLNFLAHTCNSSTLNGTVFVVLSSVCYRHRSPSPMSMQWEYLELQNNLPVFNRKSSFFRGDSPPFLHFQ